MTAEIDRISELADSLRAMHRNAKNAYVSARPGACHSITMDSTRLGDLSGAADMLERLAAEIERLNAPAVLLTDERIEEIAEALPSRERPGYLNEFLDVLFFAEQIQNATLAANGKAVS